MLTGKLLYITLVFSTEIFRVQIFPPFKLLKKKKKKLQISFLRKRSIYLFSPFLLRNFNELSLEFMIDSTSNSYALKHRERK